MSFNVKLPQATSDPLDQPVASNSHPQSDGRAEPDTRDDSHIQKGMANRNFKTWAMVAGAIAIGGMYLYPQQANKPKTAPVETTVQATPPGFSIADELAEQAERDRKKRESEQVPQTPSPMGGLVLDPKIGSMDAKAADTSIEDKQALIIASTMGVGGVDISQSKTRQQAQSQRLVGANPEADGFDSSKMISDAIAQSQKQTERIMQMEREDAQAQSAREVTEPRARFLATAAQKQIEEPTSLLAARAPATLYQGTLVRTVLTRSLKSDLPGEVTAKVVSDLYDSVNQATLLIPRGSEINCSYKSDLMVGEELMMLACTRLRLPNGKSFSLSGAAAGDMQGATGMPAEINNHFFKMFSAAAIIGATSLMLPKNQQTVTVSNDASGRAQTGGTILGTALHDVVQQILSRNARIAPTGSVEIGTPFTLSLTRDVELEPYLGRSR